MTSYQSFVYTTRYARWLQEEERRETWEETVNRYVEFFKPRIPENVRDRTVKEIREAILNMEVMPSMRAMMTAGQALQRDNVAQFNCAYVAIDDPRAFDEAMYLLMAGVGVGFSVERQYIANLPKIAEEFYQTNTVIKVRDSRIGWASAFKEMVSLLYSGMIPKWDVSLVRPAGMPLKTFGGRASGPRPLEDLFNFSVTLFKNAAGRRLTSIECHDLMCKIADIVVVGGVRRSAMISLSNLSDDRMRNAKNGQWWAENGQRALANNSAVYTERPDVGIFLKEWTSLFDSKCGERGIFNRAAAAHKAEQNERRTVEGIDFGTNPCGEIVLRNCGLCNLSEVIVRPDDTQESLRRKVRVATIIGTLQSAVTNFRYLRSIWKKNAEEERLLGVSLTGIMDNQLTYTNDSRLTEVLSDLRQSAINTNEVWATKLGINKSSAITCVKPSGTVSQLVGCSSGIHPAYGRYIKRAVRADKKDPVVALMKEIGIENEPDVTKPDDVVVFYFPIKTPETSVLRKDLTATDQLELYLTYRRNWCEHNPSCTVYVRESEWVDVAAWVYKNFDEVGGLTFLPYANHSYRQAPYTEVTQQEYEKALEVFPQITWERLSEFEKTDHTEASHELACSAGNCELV